MRKSRLKVKADLSLKPKIHSFKEESMSALNTDTPCSVGLLFYNITVSQ